LTGSEVDAMAGLLYLRERHPFRLYGAASTLATIEANPIFRVLDPNLVHRTALPLEDAFLPLDAKGTPLGLRIEAYAVPGKVPLFAEAGDVPAISEEGEAVGLAISAGEGAALHFIPGCAAMTPALAARLRGASTVLFDGTLWQDDEMIRQGAGAKTSRRMGHMPVSGTGGTIEAFATLGVGRRILVHLNNTNPLLQDDSPEHAELAATGWEVGEDGMEVAL
jgi:pyrroloquinoline quinone biosynthesis protein B